MKTEEKVFYKDLPIPMQSFLLNTWLSKLKLDPSKKETLGRCFYISDPAIVIVFENEKVKALRLEEKDAATLKVLIREHLHIRLDNL